MNVKKLLSKDLLRITNLWMEGSLTEQGKLFNSSKKNQELFKKAKSMAKY
jgi:hypothetical protein